VFMLVSEECSEMAIGRKLEGALPRLTDLEGRRAAERSRMSLPSRDIRRFWRDYLLGRGDLLGIELINATRAYEGLMAEQLSDLQLTRGSRVADVGCGTGSFLLALSDSAAAPTGITVDEIDYVPEAFDRAKLRLKGRDLGGVVVRFVECDLENPAERDRIFAEERYDAALLSLVLSYVQDPLELLRSVSRAMRPGARIVVSTLQRDADISRLYLESLDEMRAGRARDVLGVEAEIVLDESQRTFLNDMARVLDLEEQGIFRFSDAPELVALVREAGFDHIKTSMAFGDPPQAVVVTAQKAS